MSSIGDRSYGTTHADGNTTVVQGDLYGTLVNKHYHVQAQEPHLQKLDLLLKSLPFDRMDARLRNVSQALPNTCQWLLRHEKFRAWVDPLRIREHHGFLWVKGKPGCGKSTIMKLALDRARKEGSERTILSYFFNARAPNTLERSSLGLYRSLAHQILIEKPVFQRLFAKAFSYKEKDGKVDEWTAAELQDFLVEVVKSPEGSEISIFVDALDEGDKDDIRRMIAFLEDVGGHAVNAHNRIRLCLSSRHFPHITIRKGLILVVEDQTGHSGDIKTFVEKKLVGDQSFGMCSLRQEVCDKSAGIFLWVALVVPMLNATYDDGGSLEATWKHLRSIPPELDDLFADILTRTHEDIEECAALLQFVLISTRPLSPSDLYTAIYFSRNQTSPAETPLPDTERLARRLLHYSRGLVEVIHPLQPVVQFIHESVRDFLVTPRGLAHILSTTPQRAIGMSHEKLKIACLQCVACFRNSSSDGLPETKTPSASASIVTRIPPFLTYATAELFRHADSAQQGGISQAKFLNSLEKDFAKWVKLHDVSKKQSSRKYAEVTLLYFAVIKNLIHLVCCLLDEGVDINAAGGRYGNALQAACITGSTDMIQLLLDRGADPNWQGGKYGHAVAAAVNFKNTKAIAILQKYELKLPKKVLRKMFKVSFISCYLPGIEVSLDQGLDVNALEGVHGWALYTASETNHEDIVRTLLASGADVNAQWGEFGSALMVASFKGYETIVQMLVDAGADVNAQGGLYYNPLMAASFQGHEIVVQILLYSGADVNAQGGAYGNALQAASIWNHKGVVQTLLHWGADVNAKGGRYGNALCAAAIIGSDGVVPILLEWGADVNAQGGLYDNALCAASKGGHGRIAQMLLDVGADANAEGSYGNALQVASANHHQEVVQILQNHEPKC